MFTVTVEADGLRRRFDLVEEAATGKGLEPALRRFGAHLRKSALARYAAQEFAPLAASTLEKRAAKGVARLERKLTYDLKKAKGRAWQSRRDQGLAPRGSIMRTLSRLTGGDLPGEAAVANTRGVRNRFAVLEEFNRRHRGGSGGAALSNAQTRSLNAREERAVTKAVGAPILGRLARSLVVTTDSASVTLESRSHGKFTEIHNEGGTAGHGAKIPKRETIKVDNTDLDIFKAILVEHHLIAFESME